jgi:hypothetical protein
MVASYGGPEQGNNSADWRKGVELIGSFKSHAGN